MLCDKLFYVSIKRCLTSVLRLELASDTHDPVSCHVFDSQQDYLEARSPEEQISSEFRAERAISDVHGVLAHYLAQYNNNNFSQGSVTAAAVSS